MASFVRAPRSLTGTPTASNSCWNSPPTPTPTESLPPDQASRSASCLATITGGYSGSTRMAAPTRTRSVHAVMSAKRVMASPVGCFGRMWPPCQTDSIGRRSTAASQSRSGSGSAAAPMMMRSSGNGFLREAGHRAARLAIAHFLAYSSHLLEGGTRRLEGGTWTRP